MKNLKEHGNFYKLSSHYTGYLLRRDENHTGKGFYSVHMDIRSVTSLGAISVIERIGAGLHRSLKRRGTTCICVNLT